MDTQLTSLAYMSLLSAPLGYLGTSNLTCLFNLLPKIYVAVLFTISVEDNLVLQVGEAKNLSHPLFYPFFSHIPCLIYPEVLLAQRCLVSDPSSFITDRS